MPGAKCLLALKTPRVRIRTSWSKRPRRRPGRERGASGLPTLWACSTHWAPLSAYADCAPPWISRSKCMRMTTSDWARPIRWPRCWPVPLTSTPRSTAWGERAGNAPLEEAVMALRHLYSIETGIDPRHLPALSALVARASGRNVALNKSIVGEAVFTHESGIHVDGLIKNPLNYQSFDPMEIGREHRLVLGKHSGSRAVLAAYTDLGIPLTEAQAQAILLRIRDHAVTTKRSPNGDELRRFFLEAATYHAAHS